MWRLVKLGVTLACGMLLAGCAAVLSPIENPAPPYAPEKLETGSVEIDRLWTHTSWAGSVPACDSGISEALLAAKGADRPGDARSFPLNIHLSRGDRINLTMIDGSEFNGDYVIGPDGKVGLPYIPRLMAAGVSEEDLAVRIDAALRDHKLLSSDAARVSVRVVKYAAIQVSVGGAVFQPGFVTINDAEHPSDTGTPETRIYGDSTMHRNLTAAIREASGVRPDADLSDVEVIRRGKAYRFDLRGAITGRPLIDPALEDGDQVFVASTGCFQHALVRPSVVTPRGIRIYVSKIHIGPDARYDEKIPFGLRLLQGAIIASCVGGNLATEGRRQIVLVSTNPATGATEVVQRSVEQLVRDQNRDEINPMLMPDDAIACYDSTVREATGIASAVGTIANSITSVVTAQRLLSGKN